MTAALDEGGDIIPPLEGIKIFEVINDGRLVWGEFLL